MAQATRMMLERSVELARERRTAANASVEVEQRQRLALAQVEAEIRSFDTRSASRRRMIGTLVTSSREFMRSLSERQNALHALDARWTGLGSLDDAEDAESAVSRQVRLGHGELLRELQCVDLLPWEQLQLVDSTDAMPNSAAHATRAEAEDGDVSSSHAMRRRCVHELAIRRTAQLDSNGYERFRRRQDRDAGSAGGSSSSSRAEGGSGDLAIEDMRSTDDQEEQQELHLLLNSLGYDAPHRSAEGALTYLQQEQEQAMARLAREERYNQKEVKRDGRDRRGSPPRVLQETRGMEGQSEEEEKQATAAWLDALLEHSMDAVTPAEEDHAKLVRGLEEQRERALALGQGALAIPH
jgi:hypothetical protein